MSPPGSDDQRHPLEDSINDADKARRDQKFDDAHKQFKEIEGRENFDSLPDNKKHFVWAHHGVALADRFKPYSDRSGDLKEAEALLRKALDLTPNTAPSVDNPREYPWALAHLGEVYRRKGNLPAFSFQWDATELAFQLKMTSGEEDYKTSLRYFKKAIELAGDSYSWARAHHAAVLLNGRRYHLDDEPNHRHARDIFVAATKELEDVARLNRYKYPWAVMHISVAQFLSALTTFADKIQSAFEPLAQKSKLDNKDVEKINEVLEKRLNETGEWLFALFLAELAFVKDPGRMYRYPVQPGAVSLDPFFAATYDLLDYTAILMKTLSPDRPSGLDDPLAEKLSKNLSERRLEFLGYIERIVKLNSPSPDDYLPGSAEIRRSYVEGYVAYLKGPDFVGLQQIFGDLVRKAADTLTRYPVLHGNSLPESTSNEFLIRVFDIMMILIKAGAIISLSKLQVGFAATLEGLVERYNEKLYRPLKSAPSDAIAWMTDKAGSNLRWLHPVMVKNDDYKELLKIV